MKNILFMEIPNKVAVFAIGIELIIILSFLF
jgi:hypothetical protein